MTIRIEINELKKQENREKDPNADSLKDQTDKPLATLMEKRIIQTQIIEMKRIIKKYYEHHNANIF